MADYFNKLSPEEHERISLLLEEMGEAQQIIGKILRHGYESFHPADERKTTNRRLLEKELGHVRFAMIYLCDCNDLSKKEIHEHAKLKNLTVGKYLHHQRL